MVRNNPSAAGPAWLQALVRNPAMVFYVLMGLGLAFLAGAITLIVLALGYRWDVRPEAFFCTVLTAVFLGCGGWYRRSTSPALDQPAKTPLMVLFLGGLLGLDIIILSIWRGVRWWDVISGGVEKWQSAEGWRLWVVILCQVVGLVILFVSFLLARSEEQDNPTLRRLLYGYVAGLTGLLLLEILLVINVLAYLYMPEPSDWTTDKLFTLSPQSVNILKKLDKPLNVHILLANRGGGRFYEDVNTLLDNMRGLTDKVQKEWLLRDRDPARVRRLKEEYQLPDSLGLLLVYGEPGQTRHQFIKQEDLYHMPPMERGERFPKPTFKGEDAIISALAALTEGPTKPVVYFTQGNGELDIGVGQRPGTNPLQRADLLVDRLQKKGNYEIKGLILRSTKSSQENPRLVVANEVPKDAVALVIAGPQQPFDSETLKALDKYMNVPQEKGGKGKLLVLADVVPDTNNKMKDLNLEKWLESFNVGLGQGRVLWDPERGNPATILVYANPILVDQNPVAAAFQDPFGRPRPILMTNVRSVQVRPSSAPQPGMERFQANELLQVLGQLRPWVEEDLRDPREVVEKLRADPDKLEAKIGTGSLSVAALVTDPPETPRNPMDRRSFMERGEGKPRMVVVGNAGFISNTNLSPSRGELGDLDYTLFAGSLAWLREKPSSIGIPPKEHKDYQVDAETPIGRMLLLPFSLMTISIVGLGLGIWLVRRQ